METAFLLRLLNAHAACEAQKRETMVSVDSHVRSVVQRRPGWVCSLSAAGFSSRFSGSIFWQVFLLASVPWMSVSLVAEGCGHLPWGESS